MLEEEDCVMATAAGVWAWSEHSAACRQAREFERLLLKMSVTFAGVCACVVWCDCQEAAAAVALHCIAAVVTAGHEVVGG